MSSSSIHETADVSVDATISNGTRVWHYAQVRERAFIGKDCVVGRGAYIGSGVRIGDNCKIQNYALVYEPANLEDGVFIGPAVVLTNDRFPRAINEDGTSKSASDWEPVGVKVMKGASIGARSVCIAPVTIGEWSLVGSGSTVVRDVPNYALVVGNPARRIGWVGKSGHPLAEEANGIFTCPVTGTRYRQVDENTLIEAEC